MVPALILNAAAFQRSQLLLLGCVYMFVVCVVGGRGQLLHLLNFPKHVCTINHLIIASAPWAQSNSEAPSTFCGSFLLCVFISNALHVAGIS